MTTKGELENIKINCVLPKCPERKVIQISISVGDSSYEQFFYALCDDGTIWDKDSFDKWHAVTLPPGCEA